MPARVAVGASPEPEPLGFGGYVTCVPALPCLAAPSGRQRILLAGGGGGLRPPFLACGAALGPVPGPVPAVVCASSLTACPPPQGGGPPLSLSNAAGLAGPSSCLSVGVGVGGCGCARTTPRYFQQTKQCSRAYITSLQLGSHCRDAAMCVCVSATQREYTYGTHGA